MQDLCFKNALLNEKSCPAIKGLHSRNVHIFTKEDRVLNAFVYLEEILRDNPSTTKNSIISLSK